MLHLYDTASGEVRPLAQREPGVVSIYLCGPTVYGPPHLGHGRATLVYDIPQDATKRRKRKARYRELRAYEPLLHTGQNLALDSTA